jgi:hypothetical protein
VDIFIGMKELFVKVVEVEIQLGKSKGKIGKITDYLRSWKRNYLFNDISTIK